jgi:nicotinate-nucleotide adenylyltransferase
MQRLGLLGGTFDPIHYGHLDAAQAAFTALNLDQVRVIPAHDPPHRPASPHANAFHRFALVSLAISDAPWMVASDQELRRAGAPSYTIDTLRDVQAEGWQPSQIFFIIGTDAFAEIATWRAYPAVLDAANFVVIARPGTTIASATARVPALADRVVRRSLGEGGMRPADSASQCSIFLVEARTRDVSSTQIRSRLAAQQPIDDLVPAAVARHILAHHLYGAVDHLHGQESVSSSD